MTKFLFKMPKIGAFLVGLRHFNVVIEQYSIKELQEGSVLHNPTVASSQNSWGLSMKSTFAAIVFRGRDLLFKSRNKSSENHNCVPYEI